jgi:malate dehydrogenase
VATIAIVGAGPLGGSVAHKLALRNRVDEVRLIDAAADVARGKALDMLQSAPIELFATRITAADSLDAAAGAAAVILADAVSTHAEHSGEAGLAMLRRLLRAGVAAPIILAGATQRELIALAVRELQAPRKQVIGSAPLALESALRAVAALTLDGTGAEIALRVVGVPPDRAVVAWEEATVSGLPIASQVPPHTLASLAARVKGLWPPGPYALGSAAARVAEAVAAGSRRRHTCFVSLDRGSLRSAVAAMPVEIGPEGVVRVIEPALTRQERTQLENALEL